MCVAIPPLPQYVFTAWCLVKHRDNFTFPPHRGVSFKAAKSPSTDNYYYYYYYYYYY
jgi:hypothetical protein